MEHCRVRFISISTLKVSIGMVMTYWKKTLLLVVCVVPWAVTAQDVAPRTPNIKTYRSPHLNIYYVRGFHRHVEELAEGAEAYLADLSQKWSIILPKKPIDISLGETTPGTVLFSHSAGPTWLSGNYDTRYRRIDIRVATYTRFQSEIVLRELEHQLIHYLLNLHRDDVIPPFLEEGLAQYYRGPKMGKDRFWAIWGFFKAESLPAFLKDSESFAPGEDFLRAAAVSRRLAQWMFRERPQAEQVMLQQLLRGLTWQKSMGRGGFSRVDDTLSRFEMEIRPKYKPYMVLLTVDLWLISLGLVFLVKVGLALRRAYVSAKMSYTELVPIGVAVPDSLDTSELFQGPAFQRPVPEPSAEEPVAAPEERVPAMTPQDTGDGFFQSIDGDLDQVFEHFGKGESPDSPSSEQGKVKPPVELVSEETGSGPRGNAYLGEKPEPVPAEKKKESNNQIEEDIDRLFGDWENQ